jgi:beta-glucosidase
MQDVSLPVERLGIKTYNWWNEALHGVARSGLATVFPQPIGMAASFDDKAVFDVFSAVSDEARAKYTFYASRGSFERYQGLTMWTPTINIFRDPRWGRGIETYGEDPYLTSRMGVMAVKGLQGETIDGYDKLHACAKHFAVHSGPEWNRHSYNAENIKPRDLFETYLPAFEALVKEAKVKELMCAYNRFEGEPCCGSNRLLIEILRNDWGFDGVVVADCGAVADFYNDRGHKTHVDAASGSAAAVLSGTDLDCGSSYKSLIESVKRGLVSEADIDKSVARLLKARFELGEMDNLNDVYWSKIPLSVVGSEKHNLLSLEMARKSMTLLHNNGILPLKRGGMKIAVMGPNAHDSIMQWGNYNGTPPQTVTILDGIRGILHPDDVLIYEQGCGLVERTLLRSVFDKCSSDSGKGFLAKYWNNLNRQGEPDVVTTVASPFRFCTSGATVFAPGVNLTDFSATYSSVFKPDQSGEVVLDLYAYGTGRIRIDGVEVKAFANRHGGRATTHRIKVDAGKEYNIEIDYEYLRSDALLNFDIGFKEDADIKKSVDKVRDADVVIFAGGISPSLEGEEMGVDLPGFKKGDRTDIELPAIQRELIDELYRIGKKIVFVNCSGSPIGLQSELEKCDAILQAWYPGQQGGIAVAEVLFGEYNPAGRLPVTFYKGINQLPDFENYDMAGRTYRYMHDAPLFPFGYGLSYTNFVYGDIKSNATTFKSGDLLKINVPVTNAGRVDGDEVVQLYLRKKGDVEGPVKTLRSFKRVNIAAGITSEISFEVSDSELLWWNKNSGKMDVVPGEYEILVGGNSNDADLRKCSINVVKH